MCPRHRKRQVVLMRDELYGFVGWVVVLAAVSLLLRQAHGLAQWLPGGALAAAGVVALALAHRRRRHRVRELEHDYRACSACQALP